MTTPEAPTPDLMVRGEYKKLLEFYPRIKRLVSLCEKADPQQRANLSPIAEMRSALDHIMRAHSRLYEILPYFDDDGGEPNTDEEDKFEYCRKHLDKARGHLYRAGYDSYDVISMSLLDDIYGMEISVSKEAFYGVIPNGAELLQRADRAKEWFTTAKVARDIESSDVEQGAQFDAYEQATVELAEIRKVIRSYMRQLVEWDQAKKESEREDKSKEQRENNMFTIQVILVIIGGLTLIAAVVTIMLMNKPKNTISPVMPKQHQHTSSPATTPDRSYGRKPR